MSIIVNAPEFVEWPKMPRLFRDMIVTEKIDGTNACIVVTAITPEGAAAILREHASGNDTPFLGWAEVNGSHYAISAQSRSRTLSIATDNFEFAAWVADNAAGLIKALGLGYHYGEWWGKGVQRGYGLDHKRFSLFDTKRWDRARDDLAAQVACLDVAPILTRYTFDTDVVKKALDDLRENGSVAAPGFMRPEGVIVRHGAAQMAFKALIENDDKPKGATR